LIKDFNDVLEQVVNQTTRNNLKSPLMIFTFSDSNEITKQFLNKLFSRKVMIDFVGSGFVKVHTINPPTDKEIDKVL